MVDRQSERRCSLITGSTQGIGLAIAERLAAAGIDIVLHGIEPDPAGAAIAQRLATSHGIEVAYLRADLAHEVDAENLIARAGGVLRPADILVNNAGIQFTCPIETFPAERWNAIIAVNLTAAFLAMRAAVPWMRKQQWGRIINIASVHGLVASVNKTAYLASKHGLVGMSKGVALETAAAGITVNCICPGWTDTPIIAPQITARAEQFGGDREAAVRDLLSEKQPNLTLLKPSQIADVVAFLCSEAASGITGVALPVDGGWTAQ